MSAAGGAQSHWSSRFSFLMASVGFAVGLGNIWRFPYVTGENGGAAFVLVYLACVFGIGVPILINIIEDDRLRGRKLGFSGKRLPRKIPTSIIEEQGSFQYI